MHPSLFLCVWTAALALCAAAAPSAHAEGRTRVFVDKGRVVVRSTVDPGQQPNEATRNIVGVSESSAGVVVEEFGIFVIISADAPCSLLTTTSVLCPTDPAVTGLEVTTGDGPDQIAIQLPAVSTAGITDRRVYGGRGADLILGSPGADRLEGEGKDGNGGAIAPGDLIGNGPDIIFAGLGPDDVFGHGGKDYLNGGIGPTTDDGGNTIDGGPGSDFFDAGSTAGPDTFVGGANGPVEPLEVDILFDVPDLPNETIPDVAAGDTLSYATRTYTNSGTQGVKANLNSVADDGNADGSENDAIRGDIESIEGTVRDDELTGSGGPNRLVGQRGIDTLRGGSGGADGFDLNDGTKDRCYVIGNDDFVDADLADPTPSDCKPRPLFPIPFTFVFNSQPVDETIPYVEIGSLKRKGERTLTARVKCAREAGRTCTGQVSVARQNGGAALGRKRFRVRPGRVAAVALKLPAARMAALRRDGRVQVTTTSQGTSDRGPTTTQVQRRVK